MIKWQDAIRVARGLLGTPYAELDCINLIKKAIRTSPGGVPGYTTAGTNSLWDSYGMSAKYKDLTWRQEGIAGARAGMIAFKRTGSDVHHAGIVTDVGTVIHSSSTQGGRGVVETPLTAAEGWNLLGVHRYIETKDKEEEETGMSEKREDMLFYAEVVTASGPLNLREEPRTGSMVLERMPKGSIVEVIEKTGLEWWKVRYKGETGYASEEYLSRVMDAPEDGETLVAGAEVQIVITDEAGNTFRPVGDFTVSVEILVDGEPLEETESID